MLSSWMSLPFTHVRKRLFLSRRSALSSHEFQLFFHVCSTDLGVANSGLDGWGPFHGHMPQIIGDLFQRPASLAGTMRKIMAQIMKRESSDEFPFLVVGLPLEALEPLVNAIFGGTRTPRGRKDVGTRALTPAMLEVVIQGATCLVQQIDVTELLALVSDMEPADLRTHMRVFHQEVCRIAHTASGPGRRWLARAGQLPSQAGYAEQ